MIRKFYIYLITNTITHKQYIGSRINYKGSPLDDPYMGSSKYLKKDYKILGIENFTKEILLLEDYINKEKLLNIETSYILKYNTLEPNGYNRFLPNTKPGFHMEGCKFYREENPFYGKKHTEEFKRMMKEKNTGKKYTKETNQKKGLAGNKNAFYGKKHTKESIEKQSNSHKGNQSWVGKNHSEESKLKISKSLTGLLKGDKNGMYGKPPWNKGLKKIK